MAISMAPLIPLNRVVPSPDARFQRFGVNGTQLFGKPMVQLGTEATGDKAHRTVLPAAPARTALQAGTETQDTRKAGQPAAQAQDLPATASAHSGWAVNRTGPAAASAPGSLVDLKA